VAQSGYGAGVYAGGGGGHLVYNNVIYQTGANNYAWGISLRSNTVAYNNTVYNNVVGIEANGSGIIVRNNISFGNVTAISGSPAVSSNNLSSDPMFLNVAAYDFHLQAGSAAINSGVTLSEVPNDFDGTARPQGGAYDIGAYEYVP